MSGSALFDLTGRVAVITGGAGLLGMQHAHALADAGASIVIVDLDPATCEAAAAEVGLASSRPAMGVAADVSQKPAVERMTEQVIERFGRIDILINNAALTVKGGGALADAYFARFEEYPLELWQKAFEVNVTGAFLCCQSIGRQMVAQRNGVILNIASDVGIISPDHRIYDGVISPHTGRPFNTPPAYATTKAALIHLTRYLATYWAKDGIRVNALSPGGVYADHDAQFLRNVTDRIPMGRMARANEYQGAVLFLVSDASSYMTGANLIVDGGRTAW